MKIYWGNFACIFCYISPYYDVAVEGEHINRKWTDNILNVETKQLSITKYKITELWALKYIQEFDKNLTQYTRSLQKRFPKTYSNASVYKSQKKILTSQGPNLPLQHTRISNQISRCFQRFKKILGLIYQRFITLLRVFQGRRKGVSIATAKSSTPHLETGTEPAEGQGKPKFEEEEQFYDAPTTLGSEISELSEDEGDFYDTAETAEELEAFKRKEVEVPGIVPELEEKPPIKPNVILGLTEEEFSMYISEKTKGFTAKQRQDFMDKLTQDQVYKDFPMKHPVYVEAVNKFPEYNALCSHIAVNAKPIYIKYLFDELKRTQPSDESTPDSVHHNVIKKLVNTFSFYVTAIHDVNHALQVLHPHILKNICPKNMLPALNNLLKRFTSFSPRAIISIMSTNLSSEIRSLRPVYNYVIEQAKNVRERFDVHVMELNVIKEQINFSIEQLKTISQEDTEAKNAIDYLLNTKRALLCKSGELRAILAMTNEILALLEKHDSDGGNWRMTYWAYLAGTQLYKYTNKKTFYTAEELQECNLLRQMSSDDISRRYQWLDSIIQ